jgi:phosphatidate cytidylyltransferase
MKQRIITGAVIAAVFAAMLAGLFTPVFAVALVFLCAMSVHEIMNCIGLKNVPMRILAYISAITIPLIVNYKNTLEIVEKISQFAVPALILYVILQLVFMVFRFKDTDFPKTAVVIFTSIAVPESFSIIARLRDLYLTNADLFPQKSMCVFIILIAMSCSWVSDVFALFVGSKFGKHKLCPNISPKKTIEGAIGGVLSVPIVNILAYLVMNHFFFTSESPVISWRFLIPVSFILPIVSIFGDLSASIMKRNFNVKDFGKLMPGHGGIMDRFDSTIFVLAVLYAVLQIYIKGIAL